MSLRLIHAADLHMDSPFEGLSAEKAALRRAEQRQLPAELAELCRREGAQLLLLAGDLLDSADAWAETGETLLSVLSELSIPVMIAPGNHDWVSRSSPYVRLPFPANVHIFRRPRLECVPLPELGVRVWGAGYTDNRCPPLLRGFAPEKAPGQLDILVLHGEVGRPASPYCPMTEEELAGSGMDYAALGHVHTCSGLRRAGSVWYAWPGCPEGRGFDECGEKGVLSVSLSPGAAEARFLPLGRRRYERLAVEAGADPLRSVLSALPEGTQRDVYRILLTGECDAPPDLAALSAALEDRFFALSLRDGTEPRRDLWARAAEDNLHGLFLRRMKKELEAAPDEASRQLVVMAVRAGLAAMEGREAPL